jgi:hypothetical protein
VQGLGHEAGFGEEPKVLEGQLTKIPAVIGSELGEARFLWKRVVGASDEGVPDREAAASVVGVRLRVCCKG